MKRKLIIGIVILIAGSLKIAAIERYELRCNRLLLLASRDSLIAQVGVRERTGNNDGERVEGYLRSVGLSRGNPYCAAGQYWCFWSAAKDMQMASSQVPIARTGSTVTMFNEAKKRGKLTKYGPKIDDLIFWRRPSEWRGHVERIISVKKAGWMETIGFNTSSENSGSQDEGEGVFKRQRNIYHPLGRMVVRGLIGFSNER